jgi:uncharacterized membrane protein
LSIANAKRSADSERAISRVLRGGVVLSLLLVSTGTALSFLSKSGAYGRGPGEVARLTGSGGSFPRTTSWLIHGLAHLDGQAVVVLGLIVLILTPIVRVAVSIVAFAREGDRVYAFITTVVFLLLMLSFALGKAG